MTAHTKPTKEATTPLPVLTEDRVINYRAWCAARVGTLSGADIGAALADHWLRTQAWQWQPMATAPTSGDCEHVLLLFAGSKQSVGYYDLYYAEGGNGYESRYGNEGAWIEPCSGERLMLHYDPPIGWRELAPPQEPA